MRESGHAAAGQIGAAIAIGKQRVAGKERVVFGQVVANAARRVPGRGDHAHGHAAHFDIPWRAKGISFVRLKGRERFAAEQGIVSVEARVAQ